MSETQIAKGVERIKFLVEATGLKPGEVALGLLGDGVEVVLPFSQKPTRFRAETPLEKRIALRVRTSELINQNPPRNVPRRSLF